ncbi:MAG: hypothetical protein RLZZ401_1311 [Pseudomonadota bacterium]
MPTNLKVGVHLHQINATGNRVAGRFSDPMPTTLFTLGYEGLTIDAFIARLQAAQVQTVVDVRELPLSRKKGFSKSAFCAALSAHGVAYLHAPALGCPKPIRNQYKADGNWQTYTREFFEASWAGQR